MASRLWKFLNTDIRELGSLDTVEGTKDAADAVLGLAEVLQTDGPDMQQLAPLVTQLDSLLDVLNSPLGNIVGASLPFVPIATGLLKFYLEKTKQEPTVAQSVALVSQAAYLATVKEFLEQPQCDRWLTKVGDRPASKLVKQKLQRLEVFGLTDTEARRALFYFHESKLAEAYGEVLTARLSDLGIKSEQASGIADKLARKTNRLMLSTLVNCSDSIAALVEWLKIGGKSEFEKFLSIDIYLEEVIAPRPEEKGFAEKVSFREAYVPMKAQPLTGAGKSDETQEPVVLEQWARQMLNDDEQKGRVMFVQGGPGRGKSVFCSMLADWVRRYEHPRWTPILIRLRDVSVLSRDFEETLAKAVDRDFAKTDSGWLTDRNVNFLFILDGFDELLMEGRTSGGLDNFLNQVGRFQEQCARNSEKNHRVLITGRTLALQAIESRMPSNLARIEIVLMDDETQLQWLERWDNLIGQNKNRLMESLQDARLPERVRELAREPLLLYLLAAMHRDGELRVDMFEGAEGAQAKVLIYERTLDWVLTKQRAEDYRRGVQANDIVMERDLSPNITELAPEHLRRILQEAGLCVVQSGTEFARIRTIEDRLTQDSAAKAFLETAQKRLETDDTPLRNALAAFYLQEGRQGEGSIEFVHKSFGEFLCAERIVSGLIDVCQPGRNREYDIEDPAFCWMMYDLLGCHVLTPEIVEYLTALLTKHPEFEAEKLHKRLYDFYWRWSDGEFTNAESPTHAQRKMHFLRKQMVDHEEIMGQFEIEVYTVLNIMILLWESHRYSIEFFHPCYSPALIKSDDNSWELRPYLLAKIVHLSSSLGHSFFSNYAGPFLNATDLSKSDLQNISLETCNLHSANLSDACFTNSSLYNANLENANFAYSFCLNIDLSDANCKGVDFSYTQLESANFRSSNVVDANFFNAVLASANFCFADLREADFSGSRLSSDSQQIQWNEDTNWEGVKGLESAIGVPEALKRQLGLLEE